MLCFDCGEGRMKLRDTAITEEFRGETVTVAIEALVCAKCGYRSIPGDKIGLYGKLLVEAFREKRGLLTGPEIRRRRELLGMSQEAFADWLKVGIASVKRWELGAVQDEAMDELMRLKTDPVAARENYESVCRRAGVEPSESRTVIMVPQQHTEYNYMLPFVSRSTKERLARNEPKVAAMMAQIQMG